MPARHSRSPGTGGPKGPRPGTHLEQQLPPEGTSVRRARQAVVSALRAADFRGDIELALLLTSEVVTNAVRHARTPFMITVAADSERVWVRVTDGDRRHVPLMRSDDDLGAPDGRGLQLVDRMAIEWGVDTGDDDKTVWFTSG